MNAIELAVEALFADPNLGRDAVWRAGGAGEGSGGPGGGGSNGSRVRLWKLELQKLADELGLSITVCHLPPGASKWNKIEHRHHSSTMICRIIAQSSI